VARIAKQVLDSSEAPPHVVHRGPIGFVYLAEDASPTLAAELAEAIASEALVPTMMVKDGTDGAIVWTRARRLRLPEERAEVFGPDHPNLDRVSEDTIALVRHESAGAITLFGWDRDHTVSFKHENGAHGGPGPRETSGFWIHPQEMTSASPAGVLRPSDLRELCFHVLDPDRPHLPFPRPTPVAEPVLRRVRLMTYNVHGCRGMDGRYSTQRIARVIANARPDVVCLQELDQVRTRSGGVDQVHEIAAQLETEYQFHSVVEIDDGRFGNAVLSHYPLSVIRTGALPRLRSVNLVERGVLWVEVDVDGLRLQVLNTHLSILRVERHLQIEGLVSDWLRDERVRAPLVLAGDLNASMGSRSVRRLEDVLHNVTERSAPASSTWSSRFPMRRIDHVLTDANSRVLRVDVPRSRLSRVASDHLPLVVDLECRSDETMNDTLRR
jgi:endonuclease/exonuclease/phosphatase family metal-dependent hydrolase